MKYLSICYTMVLLFTACQTDEQWDVTCPPVSPQKPEASIQFVFASQPDTRILQASDLLLEESQVNQLIYAIFQNNFCRKVEAIDVMRQGIQAGGTKNYYTIQNIPNKWLDESTEIFAIANAPQALRDSLLYGKYQIDNEDPLLKKLIAQRIDSVGRADIYQSIIERSYLSDPWPKDKKVHYFPISRDHVKSEYFTLPSAYRFRNYTEFVKFMNDPTLPAEVKTTYEDIWVDLQCRLSIYRENDFNRKINDLTNLENQQHNIRTEYQQNDALQKYLLWRNKEWEKDLNQEVVQNLSQGIEEPVMTGFHALNEVFPTTIVVPVERVYNRIWFNFQWEGAKETEAIVVDEITVKGLMTKTRLFNLTQEVILNNPSEFTKVNHTLSNCTNIPALEPFFADLQLSAYPYHLGNQPQMLLDVNHPQHSTLSVYHKAADGTINPTLAPHRCYVYSYQLGGNSLNDDPEIVIQYHFEKKPEEVGKPATIIRKKATARLYDETHYPGKQHHGLLRNYTYQLNCKVNALSNTLDVQVVAVPWYKINIDDIPPFE